MVDEIVPVTLHTYTLTGPTTFITTVADPVDIWKNNNDCCGPCSIYYPTVSLKYWPVASPNTSCLDHPATSTQLAARAHDLPTNGSLSPSYAVGSDDFTYISPSVYVAFGDVTAGNLCGTVGAVHSSVTLVFAPGELSTYDWRGGARAFDPIDLPCGPGQPFYFGPMGIQGVTKGAIYKPTIDMPEKLKSLDPAWGPCQTDWYEGIDPPRALTAVAAMDPAITAAGPPPTQTPATPSSAPKAQPVNTSFQGLPDPSPIKDSSSSAASASKSHASPAPVASLSDKSGSVTASSVAEIDPPASKGVEPPSPPNGDPKLKSNPAAGDAASNEPVAAPSFAYSGFPNENPMADPTPDPAASPQLTSNIGLPEVSVSSAQISSAPRSEQRPASMPVIAGTTPAPAVVVQGYTIAENSPPVAIGGSTVDFASGYIHVGSNVAPAPTHAPQQSSGTVFQGLTFSPLPFNGAAATTSPIATLDGKTVTAPDLSGELAVDGTTIKAGDASVTVAGTPISVGAGVVAIGSTTITIATPPHNLVLTIADHPFTANPSGFSIADTTILPGSPGITVSRTPLSLAPSGALVIGSSTVKFSTPPPTPPPITLASRTITANSLSQYIIGSETLVPGDSAITVNGAPISLPANPSAVVIGSSTEFLTTTIGADIGAAILSGLGPIGPGEPTATTEANASYTGPLFTASTGCVRYRWSWQLLGLGLLLGFIHG